MANRDSSFALGSLIRFGSLDFLATGEGIELIPVLVLPARHAALGPAARTAASGRSPTKRTSPQGQPFGLRNATGAYGHLLARSLTTSPASNELVGVARVASDTSSGNENPDPSRECFMADAHSEGSNGDGAEGRQRAPPRAPQPRPGPYPGHQRALCNW